MDLEKNKVSYMIFQDSVLISAGGCRKTFSNKDKDFDEVIRLIKDKNWDKLISMVTPGFDIAKYSHLEIYVHQGTLYRLGKKVEPNLAEVIISMIDRDLPYDYLLKFWDRLEKNPEESSKKQLYTFLMNNNIAITPDGYIMGYKSVQKGDDGILYDHHTGKIPYYLHKITEMPRDQVVCDPNKGCGPGLHIGSYEYASETFSSGHILEVLVDPKDVVSVPKDSSYQKCRCCKLFVSNISKGNSDEVAYIPPKKAVKELKKDDKSMKKSSKGIKIGRYFYKRTIIPPSEVTKLSESDPPYNKLVKSDFPKFFKDMSVQKVYRQRNGKSSNYIAGNNNAYILYEVIKK